MPISLDDLDGEYNVKSETSQNGPFSVKGDGTTTIKNGMTYRKDANGCIWESAFSVIGPDKVQIESTVDPSHAGEDVYILDPKGNPTKSIVTYRSVLDAGLEDGKVILSGTIDHAGSTTHLVMKKV